MVDGSATPEAKRLFYYLKKMKREFQGIWIPAEIWLSESLTLQEKIFLVEIKSLDTKEKGCYANNHYFANFFGISKTRVSLVIKSLVEKGFITSLINVEEGNKRILKTCITKVKDPLKQKLIYNNTINNTTNKKCNIDWNQLINIFNSITGKRIKSVNDKAKRQIKNILKDYDKKDFLLAIKNCYEDDYHLETKHKYLTLEFISRADKFERFYGMQPKVTKNDLGNRANDLLNREENS